MFLDGTAIAIDDAAALGAAIAASNEARGCYALHTVRTATGIDWDATDPRIASLVADFQSDDHILTLLEAIAVSDVFRTLDVAEETP